MVVVIRDELGTRFATLFISGGLARNILWKAKGGWGMTRSQLAHPGCGVDEQGHREALVAAERCTSD